MENTSFEMKQRARTKRGQEGGDAAFLRTKEETNQTSEKRNNNSEKNKKGKTS